MGEDLASYSLLTGSREGEEHGNCLLSRLEEPGVGVQPLPQVGGPVLCVAVLREEGDATAGFFPYPVSVRSDDGSPCRGATAAGLPDHQLRVGSTPSLGEERAEEPVEGHQVTEPTGVGQGDGLVPAPGHLRDLDPVLGGQEGGA